MQLTKSKICCCVVRDQFSSRPEIKMQNENENNYVILADKIFFFYGSRQPKWLQLGVTTWKNIGSRFVSFWWWWWFALRFTKCRSLLPTMVNFTHHQCPTTEWKWLLDVHIKWKHLRFFRNISNHHQQLSFARKTLASSRQLTLSDGTGALRIQYFPVFTLQLWKCLTYNV